MQAPSPRPSPRPRAPSPLRNSTSTGVDPNDGEDSEEEEESDDEREQDSTASVTQYAASLASKLLRITTPTPGQMSSSDIERQAQEERERSRKEAERILREEGRTSLEDRVLAMLDATRALPPPPSRSQTMPPPSSSPTPSSSSTSTSWWSAAKNKLTPTKDLTPAQQVILDVKRTEKEREKAEKEYLKKSNKGSMPPRDPTEEWPAVGETKYTDPAFLNLTPNPSPGRIPAPGKGSPSFTAPNLTPSPNRNRTSNNAAGGSPGVEQPPIYAQFNAQGGLDVHLTLVTIAKRFEKLEKWTVGHVRALEERMGDVERWLVDKEEREQHKANDVSSVNTAETTATEGDSHPKTQGNDRLQSLQNEVSELTSRIGELGKEMAEMRRAQAKLSSATSTNSAARTTVVNEPDSSHLAHRSSFADIEPGYGSATGTAPDADWPNVPLNPPHKRVPSVRESTSPPLLRSLSRQTTGGRLPYPTGDYAAAPPTSSSDSAIAGIGGSMGGLGMGATSGTFSPPTSPPGSLNTRTPTTRSVVSGPSGLTSSTSAPNMNTSTSTSTSSTYSTQYPNYSTASFSSVSSISPSPSPLPRHSHSLDHPSPSTSPSPAPRGGNRLNAAASSSSISSTKGASSGSRVLPPIPPSSSSPSGNGRKRYTVALGTPITRASAILETESSFVNGNGGADDSGSGLPASSHSLHSSIGRAFFSSSPVSQGRGGDDDDDEEGGQHGKRDEDDKDQEATSLAGDETIGKSSSRSLSASLSSAFNDSGNDRVRDNDKGKDKGKDKEFTPTHSRIRAQSAYGLSSIVRPSQSQQSLQSPGHTTYGSGSPRSPNTHTNDSTTDRNVGGGGSVAPLRPRVRSQSTSPHPSSAYSNSTSTSTSTSSKFIDPLVARHGGGSRDGYGGGNNRNAGTGGGNAKLAMPRPLSGKIPIGQLVKFFDGDAKK